MLGGVLWVRGGCWLWLLAVGCPGLAWSMARVTKSCSTNSSTEALVMRKFCKCVGILWTSRTRRVVCQRDRLQTRGSRQRAKQRYQTRRVILQTNRLQRQGSRKRAKKGHG